MAPPETLPAALLRAADADRDAAVDRLRAAYAEGRLQHPELEERLGAALGARTLGELAALTGDLPPAPAPTRRPRAATARQVAVRAAWATWAFAVGVNLVVWLAIVLATREPVYFWPAWVAGPWGAVLLLGSRAGGACGGRALTRGNPLAGRRG